MRFRGLLLASLLALLAWPGAGLAQGEASAVLELGFTPTPRAQIAIWIEDTQGRFLATAGLTEAVAFRGVGNRPGASQMNSGYRWPYGRREGILPVWGRRRATAHGARQFRRVIFQDRTSEGLASRTSNDHSIDNYFCLSFNRETTRRDALDAISCASIFTSDKGRFVTDADVDGGYAEPWTGIDDGVGQMMPMPRHSFYPPRMDMVPCVVGNCYDHDDLLDFAAQAREVMPEIDAITMATPPGGVLQSVLFSVPEGWPGGDYRMLVEVHTEGDYNDVWNDVSYPTPALPTGTWDTWALTYGYAYRGQPSVVFEVPFSLGAQGEVTTHTDAPIGASSWRHWDLGYGQLAGLEGITDDPFGAPGSGADRFVLDGDGHRLSLTVRTLGEYAQPAEGEDPWGHVPLPDPDALIDPLNQPVEEEDLPEPVQEPVAPGGDDDDTDTAQPDDTPAVLDEPSVPQVDPEGDALILVGSGDGDTVGAVRGLDVTRHEDRLRAHEWVAIRFLAVESDQPLHSYEVRVATRPITDEASFIREGRPAKTATDDAEGAVSLMLPVDVPAGQSIESAIGDLAPETRYWIGVRGKDHFDRKGPISVVEITTHERIFATVTACFVATAAYGTPMAGEVGSLRRLRDRHMLTHAPGRLFVKQYYAHGPALAAVIREREWLREAARLALSPLVRVAGLLEGAE